MHDDVERCLKIVRAQDERFDGWFVTGSIAAGIYCRPSCPAATAFREDIRIFPTTAAAQAVGLRACPRCRPEGAPGSPVWNYRSDPVARAMRLIADGAIDEDGVAALAARLGGCTETLERALHAEVGAGALALAQAQRARTARTLIESTTWPMADVATAAGYASLDSLREAMRELFGTDSVDARCRDAHGDPDPRPDLAGGHVMDLRLPFRQPLNPDNLFGHLAATGVPGVEEWRDGAFRRTLRLPHGTGIVTLRPRADHIGCRMVLADLRDVAAAVSRCRRMLDLDADPVSVDERLRGDAALAPVVDKAPGRRVPGSADGAEFAIRAVLGQQVSTTAARTLAARLVLAYGEPVTDLEGGLTHVFPEPGALAEVDPLTLAMPSARRRALIGLIHALARGEVLLDAGADRAQARTRLAALPGLGPWTVETIAMRGLGDPDAFVPTDLGIRLAARRLGLPTSPGQLIAHAAAWRPHRAYAVQYLWATGDHPVNMLPPD